MAGTKANAGRQWRKNIMISACILFVMLTAQNPAQAAGHVVKPDEAMYRKAVSLALRGKHMESVNLFRKFLQQYPQSKRTPEAMVRMAESLDTGLYQYSEAMATYEQILKDYPKSRFSQRISRRLGYLRQATSMGPEPLASFERAKNEYYKYDNKLKLIMHVEAVYHAHKGTNLAPEVLMWLGEEYYRYGFDKKYTKGYGGRKYLRKAEEYFLELIKKYPDAKQVQRAQDRLSDTWRGLGEYGKAYKLVKTLYEQSGFTSFERRMRIYAAHVRRLTLMRIIGAVMVLTIFVILAMMSWRTVNWHEALDLSGAPSAALIFFAIFILSWPKDQRIQGVLRMSLPAALFCILVARLFRQRFPAFGKWSHVIGFVLYAGFEYMFLYWKDLLYLIGI